MTVQSVGVVGCGLMGSGIAQVCAQSGYKTVVREVNEELLGKGLGRIRKFLDDGIAKGKVTAEVRDSVLSNIVGTTDLAGMRECDIVVEAIVENVDAKRAVYADIEECLAETAIIASNTSSICITELAAGTRRPDRFVGLHFFNPVPLMRLVEVIRALTTSEETARRTYAFVR
jgi:3-hydroxybutyryl-CoA dehydrogenase